MANLSLSAVLERTAVLDIDRQWGFWVGCGQQFTHIVRNHSFRECNWEQFYKIVDDLLASYSVSKDGWASRSLPLIQQRFGAPIELRVSPTSSTALVRC